MYERTEGFLILAGIVGLGVLAAFLLLVWNVERITQHLGRIEELLGKRSK